MIYRHKMQHTTSLVIGFLILYSSLIAYARSSCWRDPTSTFFQSQRAHLPTYSAPRILQAAQYADRIGLSATTYGMPSPTKSKSNSKTNGSPPELCIGIPSVRRNGISYLKTTLGSLQHGLSASERASLHFAVLLAHTRPENHTDFYEPWMDGMVDQLVAYADDKERFAVAERLEESSTHEVKSKFDYAVVLEECLKTGAPYVLMVEDDVVFMDGWWGRTMEALEVASRKTCEAGYEEFLYLRLFYYEGLLGWNSESWPKYLAVSIAIDAICLVLLVVVRRHFRLHTANLARDYSLLLVTFVFVPLLILLYFAAGSNCMLPVPEGVHLMSNYGCCGQGLVFPRATVANDLLPLFSRIRWDKVATDSAIEEFADEKAALRWALTPVVMQHVGSRSSHAVRSGPAYGNMTPGHIWNFGFELNDVARLAEEHAEVVLSS